ncbi:MAG: Fic family protein [Methylobacter sp.]|uniref:Fic family protein n=1 Tax=Candidatus Methylobacter titanis TaxID=3053457 RepID=A0AA43Q7J2_9GAMM|nr:Fic family protein [Candidatus Methylobacter titanis]
MKYNAISLLDKLDQLQAMFFYSTKLAEAIGVSRRTLLNWRQKPESISAKCRLDIDVLYCRHFLIPEWDDPKQSFEAVLLPDDMPHNEALFLPFLRRLSYGTIEIETGMAKADFDNIIDGKKLPKNMDRQTFLEGFNAFMTHKQLWQRIVEHSEPMPITVENIKTLHADFMRGIYDNAGFFSTKIRVMGQLDGVQTTDPEDIDEEMYRWVYKEAKSATLEAIAKAHAYFILIHPFGDGNGRVGRALVMAQCLNARLMPPVFDGENRAMYYAAMEYAMKHGRYAPLIRLFYQAVKSK